jgi:hypothetical protein
VLEAERLRDRQRHGRRDAYPIFGGIVLKKDHVARLEAGETLTYPLPPAELERGTFLADVVDLDTGEVVFESNSAVPDDLAARLRTARRRPSSSSSRSGSSPAPSSPTRSPRTPPATPRRR